RAYYRDLTGSETTVQFDYPGGSLFTTGVCGVFRGGDPADPFPAFTYPGAHAESSSPNPPSVDTTDAGANAFVIPLISYSHPVGNNTTVSSHPSGYSEGFEHTIGGDGSAGSALSFLEKATPGSEN